MFRMMCKDLRISPLRTFLTGLSMFVGIVAVIAGVLVGTLGREFVLAVNEQILGRTPTYSLLISGTNFADQEKAKKFLEKLRQTKGKTIAMFPGNEPRFTPIDSMKHLKEIKDESSLEQRQQAKQLYGSPDCKGENRNDQDDQDFESSGYHNVVYTTSGYNEIHKLPMFKGRWLDASGKTSPLEVVLNKPAYTVYNSDHLLLSSRNTLDVASFTVVGVVNDGYSFPRTYVNIESLIAHVPSLFTPRYTIVRWHDNEGLTMGKMKSYMSDILHDTIGGKVEGIRRFSRVDSYDVVVDMLQLGLFISAALLLSSTIVGQINIGLSSLEQRTHELLIRRALGASKCNIVMLVLSSLFLLSMIVCVVSVLLSVVLVHSADLLLPHDSPVTSPTYPITAAVIAVAASVFTALLGGLIPAIKAFKLEPALALR